MALTNKKIFGLDVNRYLADAKDADASLRNIGIEPRDSVPYRSGRIG